MKAHKLFGAKTVAAGGTVTFPGLGTVTGALGGAVFGFATGYIGGALTGIASELLTSCFRKNEISKPYTYVSTNLQIPAPYGATRPIEFQDFKKWYNNF